MSRISRTKAQKVVDKRTGKLVKLQIRKVVDKRTGKHRRIVTK